MASDDSLGVEDSAYYQSCLDVSLDRKVGSTGTAANATKVMFLKESAVSFLKFTFRHVNGNKLEKELYKKFNDPNELVQLKLDALMFHHIYADLVTLAKSRELKKSVFDMNIHYCELKMFLNDHELQNHAEIVMDSKYYVFKSEKLLYQDNEKFNHRIRKKSKIIHKSIFSQDAWDATLLFPLVVAGAAAMEIKLSNYAQTQVPGGIYWNAEPEIEAILKELEPSNDICESILGLNDYLSVAIPNMLQETRSNLVEVKRNKTMQWLDVLPKEKQDKVLEMAVENRRKVSKQCKEQNEK